MINAKLIGEKIGKAAVEKGVSKIYLDRGPNIYHGIIKIIADSARSTGLKF
jgi:large subunit ribosomal protein L18